MVESIAKMIVKSLFIYLKILLSANILKFIYLTLLKISFSYFPKRKNDNNYCLNDNKFGVDLVYLLYEKYCF